MPPPAAPATQAAVSAGKAASGALAFVIVLVAFAVFSTYGGTYADGADGSLSDDIFALASVPARLGGSPGAEQAAEYLLERLGGTEPDHLLEQRFPVVYPADKGGVLEFDDGLAIRLRGLWPNTARTPTLRDHSGPLVYAADGELSRYDGQPVENAIVVLEWSCGARWYDAFVLGARAVIFIGPGDMTRADATQKFLNTPLDMPRFYVTAEDGAVLRERASVGRWARLDARMDWQSAHGRNLLAFYRGGDPALEHEVVVVQAHYDSISVVPSVNPGASQACSAAAALAVAQEVGRKRPARSVLVALTDAHFLALGGARHLAAAFAEGGVASGTGSRPAAIRSDTEITRRIRALEALAESERRKLPALAQPVAAASQALLGKTHRETRRDVQEFIARGLGGFNRALWEYRVAGCSEAGPLERVEAGRNALSELSGLFARLRRTPYERLSQDAREAFEEVLAEARLMVNARLASLESRKQVEEDAAKVASVLQGYRIALVVGVDITDANSQFGIFPKGDFFNLGSWVGETSLALAYSPLSKMLAESFGDEVYVDCISGQSGRHWRSYLPVPVAFDAEAASACNYPAITFATIDDLRMRFDTPLDTFERLEMARVERQVSGLVSRVRFLCDDPDLAARIRVTDIPPSAMCVIEGDTRELLGAGKTVPDDPVSGAFVAAQTNQRALVAVRPELVAVSDAYGFYRFVNVRRVGGYSVNAWKLDEGTGRIVGARDQGEIGRRFATSFTETRPRQIVPVVLFPCRAMDVPEIIDQRFFVPLRDIRVLDARTDALPIAFGLSVPLAASETGFIEPAAVVYVRAGTSVKLTMGVGIAGPRLVLLNGSEEDPRGMGYPIDRWPRIGATAYRCALDQWRINEVRIENLRGKQIRNARVESLHELASGRLTAAQKALAERRFDEFLSQSRGALSLASRAYPEVTATGNDTVKGVVFYLALLFPFAFIAERLLFGFRRLEVRAACVTTIFLAVFAIIRAVHPAFRIIHSSLVILLAFLVFVLSAIVTWILYNRFQRELEKIRRRSVRFREVDVRRASAVGLAVTLGVSSMRRRKMRTTLTVVSIVLVCFTMISMTGMVQTLRYTEIALDGPAAYDGFLVHLPSWNPISPAAYEALGGFFAGQGRVCARAWLLPNNPGSTPVANLSYEKDGQVRVYRLGGGLVGVEPDEPLLKSEPGALAWGRWPRAGERRACVVPLPVAEHLGIDPLDVDAQQATLQVLGVPMSVVGVFDPEKMEEILDLDAEPMTPVNFLSASGERALQGFQPLTVEQQSERVQEPEERFVHLLARDTVFAPYAFVREMGGQLRSIAVWMEGAEAVEEWTVRLVQRMGLLFYRGQAGQRWLVGSGGGLRVTGLQRTALPMAIACLIVLNTMLGALFERKGEIAIESALGLAPSHIAALFVAEACVLAVLGAVLGYLLGQGVAAISYRLVPGIELNYSSFSVVLVSMLAMAMVVVPTVYPAVIASRLSAPSVRRRWEVPPSRNDEIALLLPFTFSPEEARAIAGYLHEFFASHAESTAGRFCTEHAALVSVQTERGAGYAVTFDASLSPYDMGVTQYVEMYAVPSREEKEFELIVFLVRQSGAVATWERLARTFVGEVRKRLLAWRTTGEAERVAYGKRAAQVLRE